MIHRGDVYDADFPIGGTHPAVVITREEAIPVLSSLAVVLVTTTIRGHPAEVALRPAPDLDLSGECAANCDDVATLPRARLGSYRGRLDPGQIRQLDDALRVAFGLD